MLATAWPDPFDDPDWWFEVKWDGFRVLVEWDDRLIVRSRGGHDLTDSFPELSAIRLDRRTVIDGELVVFDVDGSPVFTALSGRRGARGVAATRRAAEHPATFMAFDLLHHGEPLVAMPIEERWKRLDALDPEGWVRSAPIAGDGVALFAAVEQRGLEGIVAKRSGSRYRPGSRSPDWRKVAHRRFARAVVVGSTPGSGGRSATFGALQLGVHDARGIRYVGGVGSGFDERSLVAIGEALGQLSSDSPPLYDPSGAPKGTRWVVPRMVALVEFHDWTPDGRLRGAVFQGFVDTDPLAVTWETEGP